MTGSVIQPTSINEFREAINAALLSQTPLHICGGESKIRPSTNALRISTACYAKIVDHQASDFTITARAGTKIQDVRQTLLNANQHLPFDPACVERGATVGGLVASGLNGPCCLRHGGIRDFVIGCQYIDGHGTVVRAGGKVVKNAAGFDLPKFFIGSGGRFGLLTEVTFKVFPRPKRYRTFRFPTTQLGDAVALIEKLTGLLTFEAIEILNDNVVLARVAGEAETVLERAAQEVENVAPGIKVVQDDDALWTDLANLRDLGDAALVVKIPSSPQRIDALDTAISGFCVARRFTAAGNACLVSLESMEKLVALSHKLEARSLAGQMVLGPSETYLLGMNKSLPLLQRVKRAMDPKNIFGTLSTPADAVS